MLPIPVTRRIIVVKDSVLIDHINRCSIHMNGTPIRISLSKNHLHIKDW